MFRTELTITPQERLLPRTARVLTVGSCFADSIGERLRLNKVNALVNPLGTVFQPLALARLLRAAAGEEQDWQQHVVEARGRWQSYDFHSTIGAESPVELLQTIQEKVRQVGEFVRAADAVVLTLGTAWAYRLRETDELVSNLHKLPAGLFEKELLTADEIVNALAEVHALLRRIKADIRIVLTVSPVRHLKDTLPLNAVSKSVLRVACHYLSELLPNVSYFPAYELLTDDLRDYRFYAADMLHPSEVAEDYIWEQFARTYFDADFGRFRKEWAAVRQALGHRPLHPGAPEHRAFLDQTRERLERLASQGVEVRQELRDVQRQLAALPPPRAARLPEPEDDEERIDIGDAAGSAPAPAADPRPTDLPAEMELPQAQRPNNRRDDRRGRGRDRRDNRPALAPPTTEVLAALPEPTTDETAATAEAASANPETEQLIPALEEAAGYPAKKKKRRSRGGAKRTARKHAARLAAEQETISQPEQEAAGETSPTDSATPAAEPLETVGAPAFAEATETAEPLAEIPAEPIPTIEAEPELPTVYSETELVAEAPAEAETTLDQALPARKRGTGPTPKKSKVITKSGLVKRGKRTTLFRPPAPTPTEVVAAPEPTTAPIVSAPIIPEILLERPAVAVAEFAPGAAEPAADAAASTAPAKPRRGRPKATPPSPAADAPLAPPVPAPEAPPAPETAPPAVASPEPAAPPKARTARAPKSAAAKPAAPRRGRPPGKKTPPAAPDAPAA